MPAYRRYRRGPRQSTSALTAKFALLAVIVTLVIGGLLAAQLAAGNDPALGPKAAARAKKTSTATTGTGSSSDAGSGANPYSGNGGGYSYGSSGSSSYSGQQYSPPPVTSSTS